MRAIADLALAATGCSNQAGWHRSHSSAGSATALRVALAPDTAEDQVAGHQEELWKALQTLPFGQRQVVVLRFIEDLSEADTAGLLCIPAGTVKSRTARGLVALRQVVREEEDV
ncbi:MAG: RNA polymerase sigma factor [Acidimicrobiales bacterium]